MKGESMITSLNQIDFTDPDCPFEKQYCFEYNGAVYEELDKSWPALFRVVLDQDDYDYIQDPEFEVELLNIFYDKDGNVRQRT